MGKTDATGVRSLKGLGGKHTIDEVMIQLQLPYTCKEDQRRKPRRQVKIPVEMKTIRHWFWGFDTDSKREMESSGWNTTWKTF